MTEAEPILFRVEAGQVVCSVCHQLVGAGNIIQRVNERSRHWPTCPPKEP